MPAHSSRLIFLLIYLLTSILGAPIVPTQKHLSNFFQKLRLPKKLFVMFLFQKLFSLLDKSF